MSKPKPCTGRDSGEHCWHVMEMRTKWDTYPPLHVVTTLCCWCGCMNTMEVAGCVLHYGGHGPHLVFKKQTGGIMRIQR